MAYTRFNSITKPASIESLQGIRVVSPASGKVSIIDDPETLALGEGVSISLTNGKIICPFNAKVIDVIPANAKVIIQIANKMKFLLQLPANYATELGLGVAPKVSKGETIAAGQTLFELDLYKIQQHLKPATFQFIVLDSAVLARIQVPHTTVEMAKDVIFSLVPLKKKK